MKPNIKVIDRHLDRWRLTRVRAHITGGPAPPLCVVLVHYTPHTKRHHEPFYWTTRL